MCGTEKMESTAGGVGMCGEHAVLTKSDELELGVRKMEMETEMETEMGTESLGKEIIGAGTEREKVPYGW